MHRRLAVLSAALVLAFPGVTHAEPGDPGSPGSPGSKASVAGQEHRAEQAKAALAKVQEIFEGRPGARARGERVDATMALRDLAMSRDSLTGEDSQAADRILARPTDDSQEPFEAPKYEVDEATPLCGDHVCIHYVHSPGNEDTVPAADTTPENGVPDYVEFARQTMELVHTTYVTAGYKAPKSDMDSTENGGDAKTDIYLADIGDLGFYGYCTTDDPHTQQGSTYQYFDVSAYCVLDNDYAAAQYGTQRTPGQNFQVTAAHEYFHAVQFAYDVLEDSWLMEGTATWVEDELFDAINDNRQYFPASPLSHPAAPVDTSSSPWHYGAWVYFRHLSERSPAEQAGLPTIIRNIWRRADGAGPTATTPAGPDNSSIQAVKRELAARGRTFTKDFSRFGANNRHPSRSYEEGAAWRTAPLAGSFILKPTRKSTGWLSTRINHLANSTARFTPSLTRASDWRMRVNVDLPNTAKGSVATVQVYKKGGVIAVYNITLDRYGKGTKTFPFSTQTVKFVEVTLTNASTRYNCWQGPGYSCLGIPLDDNMQFLIRATAYRS